MDKRLASAQIFFLVACLFLCPLLFFTNLTRNPYFGQISLLNIFALGAAAAYLLTWLRTAAGRNAVAKEMGRPPRGEIQATGNFAFDLNTPLNAPWLAWFLACGISWLAAYWGHREFFRPSMRSEGLRVFVFTLNNTFLPFCWGVWWMRLERGRGLLRALSSAKESGAAREQGEGPGAVVWIGFAAFWGILWTLFPQMRSPMSGADLWSVFWDNYGGLLWAAGLTAVIWFCRSGRIGQFFHLCVAVGFLASCYGVLQYFNMECVWPKALNPYGGRSVSTFGNPNFLSTYLVMLMPLVVVYFLHTQSALHRLVYAACFLAFEGALFSTLTRSSWAGALTAVSALFLSSHLRGRFWKIRWASGGLLSAGIVMMLLWPQSSLETEYTPTVWGRLTELREMFKRGPSKFDEIHLEKQGEEPAQRKAPQGEDAGFWIKPLAQPKVYPAVYQRLLIWTCMWQMGLENPLLGKGFGLLELFYPFYQGPLLLTVDIFSALRTHANDAHNEILEVWSQMGLLGLGIFVWLWWTFGAIVWRWIKNQNEAGKHAEWDTAWVLAGGCGITGVLVDNMLNVSLHFAVPAFLFWWWAGLMMGRISNDFPRAEPEVSASRFSIRLRRGAACLGVLYCVWGSWFWIQQWMREIHYFSGFKMIRQNEMAGALQHLDKAYRWHGREVNSNYEYGNALAQREEYEKALWAYDEALKSNAGYDEIFFNRAMLLDRLGRADGAETSFITALAINPLSHSAYAGLSQFYMRDPVKYSDRGIELFRRAVSVFPEDLNFLNNLGYLLHTAGRLDLSRQALHRALKQNPDFQVAQNNLRNTLAKMGVREDPLLGAIDSLKILSQKLQNGDHGAESVKLAEKVVRELPDVPRARFYLGNLQLLHSRFQDAETNLKRVIELDSRFTSAYNNLAILYQQTGRPEKALATWRESLMIDPNNAEARAALKTLGQLQ